MFADIVKGEMKSTRKIQVWNLLPVPSMLTAHSEKACHKASCPTFRAKHFLSPLNVLGKLSEMAFFQESPHLLDINVSRIGAVHNELLELLTNTFETRCTERVLFHRGVVKSWTGKPPLFVFFF